MTSFTRILAVSSNAVKIDRMVDASKYRTASHSGTDDFKPNNSRSTDVFLCNVTKRVAYSAIDSRRIRFIMLLNQQAFT